MNVLSHQHTQLDTPSALGWETGMNCAAMQLSGGFTLNLHQAYWSSQAVVVVVVAAAAGGVM